MYQFLVDFMSANQVIMIGMLVAFVLTFLCLRFPFSFLPKDQGREYAINGALSKGKIRGVGLILTAVFILVTLLVLPVDREYVVYCILLFAMMLSGYLDDASKNPWSDYKKGAIDLVLALLTMWNFVNYNPTKIHIGSFEYEIPVAVFFGGNIDLGIDQCDKLFRWCGWALRESLLCYDDSVCVAVFTTSRKICSHIIYFRSCFISLSVL